MNLLPLNHLGSALRRLTSRLEAVGEHPAPPIPREVEIDSSTRERIRVAMQGAGLLARDLAHTQSITTAAIEEVLDGRKSTISDGALRRIAQRLGTYPGQLLYGRLTAAERIGRRIRALREERGEKQSALADALQVSDKTVERWESGQTTPTRENIAAIAAYYGVSAAFLERGDTPARRALLSARRHRRAMAVTATLAAASAVALMIAFRASDPDHPPLAADLAFHVNGDGRAVEVRDARSDARLWRQEYAMPVQARRLAWNGTDILFIALGIESRGPDTPAFEVRDLRDGHVLVSDGSTEDTRAETRPLRGEFVSNVGFVAASVSRMRRVADFGDLDGDGRDEMFVAIVNHLGTGPAHLGAYNPDGTCALEYCLSGSIDDFLLDDFDRDGRDEVLVSGSSGSPHRSGPILIVLDSVHARGFLTEAATPPGGDATDGALMKAEWPAFAPEFMSLLKGRRVRISGLQAHRDPDSGELEIIATAGTDDDVPALVFLDGALQITSVAPSDVMRGVASAWPDGRGDAFFAHLGDWAARVQRSGDARIDVPTPEDMNDRRPPALAVTKEPVGRYAAPTTPGDSPPHAP